MKHLTNDQNSELQSQAKQMFPRYDYCSFHSARVLSAGCTESGLSFPWRYSISCNWGKTILRNNVPSMSKNMKFS